MSKTWQDDTKFDPNDTDERANIVAVIKQAYPDLPEAVIVAAIDPAVMTQTHRGRALCALLIAKYAVKITTSGVVVKH